VPFDDLNLLPFPLRADTMRQRDDRRFKRGFYVGVFTSPSLNTKL
jgi:hypothetical protein